MKNLSYISLSDENIKTPELKNYISNTLSLQRKEPSVVPPSLQKSSNNDQIKVPFNLPKKRKRSDHAEGAAEEKDEESSLALSTKKQLNKREQKDSKKALDESGPEADSSAAEQNKPDSDNQSKNNQQLSKEELDKRRSKYKSKKKQPFKRKKN